MQFNADCSHKQTDVIVMGFAKAFDNVLHVHKRLLYKPDFYGIRGSTHIKWINSWLSERSQKVVLDGHASDPVPVLSARISLGTGPISRFH